MRAAHAIFHGQVLHRLHEQRDVRHFFDLRLQTANHVGRRTVALLQRLQIDLNAPAVDRRVRSVDPDERRQTLDGRVLQDHAGQLLLSLRHRRERNILRRLGYPQDDAGVLHREESLRHVDVQQNRSDQRARR